MMPVDGSAARQQGARPWHPPLNAPLGSAFRDVLQQCPRRTRRASPHRDARHDSPPRAALKAKASACPLRPVALLPACTAARPRAQGLVSVALEEEKEEKEEKEEEEERRRVIEGAKEEGGEGGRGGGGRRAGFAGRVRTGS